MTWAMGSLVSGSNNLPNGRLLLDGLMLTPERFYGGSKAAVPLPVLRALLEVAVSTLPFDQEFYLSTYPDLRDAFLSDRVTDLKSHFIGEGYLEGRFGAKPDVDEEFYRDTYPDIAAAIARGEVESGLDHYVRSGALEGRFANARDMQATNRWLELLGRK
jgi:hypothetical protein